MKIRMIILIHRMMRLPKSAIHSNQQIYLLNSLAARMTMIILIRRMVRLPKSAIHSNQQIYFLNTFVLRQSIKQAAGPNAASLLTRINFDGRRLDGQILTNNAQNDQLHVKTNQERQFLRKRKPCGTLHNLAKGL
jgi:hypothetical protein